MPILRWVSGLATTYSHSHFQEQALPGACFCFKGLERRPDRPRSQETTQIKLPGEPQYVFGARNVSLYVLNIGDQPGPPWFALDSVLTLDLQ